MLPLIPRSTLLPLTPRFHSNAELVVAASRGEMETVKRLIETQGLSVESIDGVSAK